MAMYDFERQRAALGRQFEQQSALADYQNMLQQQQFGERRQGAQREFGRAFPRFTGQAAGRLGSGIKSGVFRQQLGENVQDYNRLLQNLGSEAAQAQSAFQLSTAARRAEYERMLEDLRAQAAMAMMNQGLGFGGSPATVGGGSRPNPMLTIVDVPPSARPTKRSVTSVRQMSDDAGKFRVARR